LKIASTFYQQRPNPANTQLPNWEESIPLPEFPPNPNFVVVPANITPPISKEKQQTLVKLPTVSPHIKPTSSSHFRYTFLFFLAAGLFIPSFFLGSFLVARVLMGRGEKEAVETPSVVPSPSPTLTQEALMLLPWRISSAFIPLPPSTTPAELTKNWDIYINPTLRFSFKYPKEWFLTEFTNSAASILKLSYPVRSNQVGLFAPGEKAYVLVSLEEKKGASLNEILSTEYDLSDIKKEEIEISGKKGWRFYNAKGKGEIIMFVENGQKIISIEEGVKEMRDLTIYQDLFLLIQKTWVFS
jgi:hypothetical protein